MLERGEYMPAAREEEPSSYLRLCSRQCPNTPEVGRPLILGVFVLLKLSPDFGSSSSWLSSLRDIVSPSLGFGNILYRSVDLLYPLFLCGVESFLRSLRFLTQLLRFGNQLRFSGVDSRFDFSVFSCVGHPIPLFGDQLKFLCCHVPPGFFTVREPLSAVMVGFEIGYPIPVLATADSCQIRYAWIAIDIRAEEWQAWL